MSREIQNKLIVLLPLLLQLVSMSFAALVDPYIRKRDRRLLLLIAALLLSLVSLDQIQAEMQTGRHTRLLQIACAAYGYSVRPAIIVLFLRILSPEKKERLLWIPIGVNAAVYFSALFVPLSFTFTDGGFRRGPLYLTCHVISFALLVWNLAKGFSKYRDTRKPEALLPVFCVGLIVAGTVVDMRLPANPYISFLTIMMVSCSLLYYIWLHLQFVRRHEQALAAEQRINIMMSQIQPHFLFNTLSTIQALCKTDPDKAFTTTGKFGDYLRQNIESLNRTDLIPMRKELEHIRIYAEIEAIRFPSVQVVYDTPDLDFTIPALTVQPLVENAIRHGVRIREQGVVTVTTRKTAAGHEITVRDNGRGFDVSALETADDTHIGLKNVRERVEQMCGGTLHVESEPGKGAAVTIRIPARADAGQKR